MPAKRITLLDRAKADLLTAKTMLTIAANDDVVMDVCAYHCQQCVEKVVKFLIMLQGESYAPDHRSFIYLEELNEGRVKELVKEVSAKIDAWATTIRYHHAILSNKKAVEEVIVTCDNLISLAETAIPSLIAPT